MKRHFFWMILALCGMISFSSCQKKNVDGGAIEVVVAGPYSGNFISYGLPARQAFELVFRETENVRLNIQDDLCDPSIAANVAANVLGSNAVAVLGHMCSGAMTAALDIYKEGGIPVISPAASALDLTHSGRYASLFFRTIPPDGLQGDLQVRYLSETLGARNVAIIHDNRDYGKGIASHVRKGLTAVGIGVPLFEGIAVGGADYSAIVNKLASVDVDVIVFGGYHPEASRLINQIRGAGLDSYFMSGDSIKTGVFLDLAGEAAEGILATGARDLSDNAMHQKAKSDYVSVYGSSPGAFFFEGYAAAQVLQQTFSSLHSSGQSISRETVRGYLSDPEHHFDTAIGPIHFDEKGDTVGIGFSVFVVKDGKFIEVQR